jgi:hypothetical protein
MTSLAIALAFVSSLIGIGSGFLGLHLIGKYRVLWGLFASVFGFFVFLSGVSAAEHLSPSVKILPNKESRCPCSQQQCHSHLFDCSSSGRAAH